MDQIIFGTPQGPTSSITPYRSLVRVSGPGNEPVTLAQAKFQCRVDTSDSDDYITSLIQCGRVYVEDVLEVTLMTSVWEARYDLFPIWAIILPRMPMLNAPVTVTYRNGDGTYSTLSSVANDFQVDYRVLPGRIYPQWARSWPPTRGDENSVTVQYSAGYGSSQSDVPPTAKLLILALVAHWFDTRQPAVVGGMTSTPYMFDTLLAASGLGVYR